jgi:hypothetical protein
MLGHGHILARFQQVAIKLVQGLIVRARALVIVEVPTLADMNKITALFNAVTKDSTMQRSRCPFQAVASRCPPTSSGATNTYPCDGSPLGASFDLASSSFTR